MFFGMSAQFWLISKANAISTSFPFHQLDLFFRQSVKVIDEAVDLGVRGRNLVVAKAFSWESIVADQAKFQVFNSRIRVMVPPCRGSHAS